MLINRKGPTQSSIANIFETVGVDSFGDVYEYELTWWFIPLSKWVISPIISGLTLQKSHL